MSVDIKILIILMNKTPLVENTDVQRKAKKVLRAQCSF